MSARARPPRITLIHGVDDWVISVEMSRRQSAAYPEGLLTATELEDRGHYHVIETALPFALDAATRPATGPA